jgi:hypothetical protein
MKDKLPFVAVGLVVVALLVGVLLYLNRGSHIRLDGRIQKVRTFGVDANNTVAIIDFRFANPANYPFVVRRVEVFCDTKDGKTLDGVVASDADAKRMLDYYAHLGPKYNDSLMIRDKVPPQASLDRMVAARFEAPEAQVQGRSRMRVRVEDVDGASSEITER